MYEVVIKESCSGYWSCLKPSDYIQVIAVFIAMLAAVASWHGIRTQKKINDENKKPVVMPGIKDINSKIEHILSDWDEGRKIPKKFSNTTLPIWNFGGSPVFNIRYNFRLEGVEDMVQEKLERVTENDKDGYSIAVRKSPHEKHPDVFDLDVEYNNVEGKSGIQIREISPIVRHADVIGEKDKINIFIPDYFIILINDYFLDDSWLGGKEGKRPTLLLKIIYDDTNLQSWEKHFRIFIPDSYRISDKEFLASFYYDVTLEEIKVKREFTESGELIEKK